MTQDIFYSGKPQPECVMSYSFAVNLFTSSILVDYAVHRTETLADWPQSVAGKLSEKEKQALESIRPILAHGWVLSDHVLTHLPLEHPAHQDWEGLYQWMKAMTDEELYQLVTEGILSGLNFYRTYMEPMPAVEEYLDKIGTRTPDEETFAEPNNQTNGLRALLISWGVEGVEESVKMISNSSRFLEMIMTYVRALWEKGMKPEWKTDEKKLRNAVQSGESLTRSQMSVTDLVIRVTGLEPEEKALRLLDGASSLVFIPCLHLSQLLSIFDIGDTCYILFDPGRQQDAREQKETEPSTADPKEANMASLLEVIGDETRLHILMLLKDQPGLHTLQISDKLGIHQSTVSRHCQQLEKNGIIDMYKEKSYKLYSLNPRHMKNIAAWFTEKLGS